MGVPTLALTADVSETHRQVPVEEKNWHLLGCQVVPGGPVLINTVGTFGVASVVLHPPLDVSLTPGT